MADALKTFFSPALVSRLAADIARVQLDFPVDSFVRDATARRTAQMAGMGPRSMAVNAAYEQRRADEEDHADRHLDGERHATQRQPRHASVYGD